MVIWLIRVIEHMELIMGKRWRSLSTATLIAVHGWSINTICTTVEHLTSLFWIVNALDICLPYYFTNLKSASDIAIKVADGRERPALGVVDVGFLKDCLWVPMPRKNIINGS